MGDLTELQDALDWADEGKPYGPEITVIMEAARRVANLDITKTLALADSMGIRHNGHNLNAPELRMLLQAALGITEDTDG